MPAASGCSLYAELLANIRQISLAVSLTSPSDNSTRVAVAADGSTIELTHHGEVHKLILPAQIPLGGTLLPIDQRQRGTTALSWRLPLGGTAPQQLSLTNVPTWSATDFEAGAQVTCRQCSAVVVEQGTAKIWKDLPSENWAEMMEFWHCHKPDHHHGDGNGHDHPHDAHSGKADEMSLAARGYGASSIISAQSGVGFVDLTTVLFTEDDCRNITYSNSTFEQGSANRQDLPTTNNRSMNIFCSSCHSQLGFYVFRTAAVTLLKWQISCKSVSASAPGITECLAATITSTISRSASSKSLIMPINETEVEAKQTVIYAWVLNASIVYSSSNGATGTPAIKLLYQRISREDADKMLEGVTCEAQEINLPAMAIERVIEHLDGSNWLLPEKEKEFKEWKVGLLTR
ncbi:ubiquitin-conjugating enzyme E2-binding protein [Triangularia verruculosa]|uniref:Ubiquitin-conjugating enzyme E2-binding protein n=1 Tax=Triangularia verruculosa TaxID=2587418 RepID=A0AAN6X953_9PEZI|nr:ubiquitin-conjugating enzyme E2-binding protein [Triangularia verruculosa]